MADLFTGQPIPVEEKVTNLRREIAMRQRVYPRLVAARRMKQEEADRGIEVMASILEDYEKVLASAKRDVSMSSHGG